VLQKEFDEQKRRENRIEVTRGASDNATPNISSLIEHIQKHVEKQSYQDNLIEVFDSPVEQGELDESPWFILNRVEDEKIINKMNSVGKEPSTLLNIYEELITGCNKVDKRLLDNVTSHDVQKYSIKMGDGVSVLTGKELNAISMSKVESELVRPIKIQTY